MSNLRWLLIVLGTLAVLLQAQLWLSEGGYRKTLERFAAEVRWPGVVRKELGDLADIIEEAQPGRTTGVASRGPRWCAHG